MELENHYYPFDPKDIDISSKQFSLYQVIRRLQHGEIYLDSYFQRRSDLWDQVKQSRFIESILIRIPIPAFYFAEIDYDKWQVIDGLQRITTLKNFIEGRLKLTGLEFLLEFNGHTVESLPVELVRRIEDSSITAFIIKYSTPDQIKYIIFDRINTGGLKLTSQEMRHALYRGDAIHFLEKLANNEIFKRATAYAISSRRMVDQEYINRFIAFYFFFEEYHGNMELFLNETLEKFEGLPSYSREEAEIDFEKAMHFSLLIFEGNAFRKISNSKKRQPINKALFEAISVNLAKCSTSRLETIVNNKTAFSTQYQDLLLDPFFQASISSGTGKKEKVDYRFYKFRELINRF